jgi:formylglycine-generating enzyme required for sulfatase activity
MTKQRLGFMLWLWLSVGSLQANNVQLSELQLLANSQLSLRISWDNSWRYAPGERTGNHDGLWVFGKYLYRNTWYHLPLSKISDEHQSQKVEIVGQTDEKGVFIRRATEGEGNITDDIVLTISQTLPTDIAEIRLYAIEMVAIPQGAFYVGDTASQATLRRGNNKLPFEINSENSIQTGTNSHQLFNTNGNLPNIIPASYPKGFDAFYVMKYEISQGQYADFLNTLSYSQQVSRTSQPPHSAVGTLSLAERSNFSYRNTIQISRSGLQDIFPAQYSTTTPERACNFMSWADLTAYLDWAALRPMTELEYEKACRGTAYPIPKEHAFGSIYAVNANTTLFDGTDRETVTETATDTSGIVNHGASVATVYLQGMLRCGFAADTANNRLKSGATYYGVMEMSGNVWEMVVNLSGSGTVFIGNNGNGMLSATGEADEGWVADNGAGYKGGAWNSLISNDITYPFRDTAISDRFYINTRPEQRRDTSGGRGVRKIE